MKNTNLIIGVVVVLLVLAGGGYYFMSMNKTATPGSAVMESGPTGISDTMLEGSSGASEAGAMDLNTKAFTVTGGNFSFDVKEMKVKKGDTVTITFKNAEGFHDWKVDEFNAATKQLQAGTEETITFVADKAGTFEYYCSVGQHRANGMVGNLIVEE